MLQPPPPPGSRSSSSPEQEGAQDSRQPPSIPPRELGEGGGELEPERPWRLFAPQPVAGPACERGAWGLLRCLGHQASSVWALEEGKAPFPSELGCNMLKE